MMGALLRCWPAHGGSAEGVDLNASRLRVRSPAPTSGGRAVLTYRHGLWR